MDELDVGAVSFGPFDPPAPLLRAGAIALVAVAGIAILWTVGGAVERAGAIGEAAIRLAGRMIDQADARELGVLLEAERGEDP
jgi:hypothetical protein